MPRLGPRVLCIAALVTAWVSAPASSQSYPSRPIRLVVPFATGGGTDLVARAVAAKMSESLGATVVVDNRAGASANIGNELVARAQPDGYTLLMTSSALAINPNLFKNLPYDPVKGFAPISLATNVPYLLASHPALGAKDFKDFIAIARAKKGTISFGSAGTGNATHLGMELLKVVAKIDLVHIPYKGTGQALNDLLGNHIQVFWATMPPTLPHIKSGRLKGLAVGSLKRAKAIPELPAVAEMGYPGFESGSWFGMLAPAGTSKQIVARLNQAVNNALHDPELNERLSAEGAEPAGNTPEEFAAFIKAEIVKWGKVIKAAGIQLQ